MCVYVCVLVCAHINYVHVYNICSSMCDVCERVYVCVCVCVQAWERD